MSLARRAKQRSTRFFTGSGSRVSESEVKPTRSPKTTVTTRRSSATAWRACPQVGQNRAPSGTVAEHDGHVTEELYDGRRRAPQSRYATRVGVVRRGPRVAPMAQMVSPPAATAGAIAARAEHAVKVYGRGMTAVTALNDVTVDFERGRFTTIMGPSGSGKSTLMHCVAGLDSLSAGRVLIGDTDLSKLNDKDLTVLRRTKVGFVFQAYNLVPTLTAHENITLPMDLAGHDPEHSWLDTVVAAVGLKDRLEHRPSELSGGQQQRVAVARALASRPEIIFADEPTGNLDSKAAAEILTFMRRAVDEFGQTIVMVTHDPVAAGYADRALFLNDGRIVDEMHDPTAERVLDRLKAFGE